MSVKDNLADQRMAQSAKALTQSFGITLVANSATDISSYNLTTFIYTGSGGDSLNAVSVGTFYNFYAPYVTTLDGVWNFSGNSTLSTFDLPNNIIINTGFQLNLYGGNLDALQVSQLLDKIAASSPNSVVVNVSAGTMGIPRQGVVSITIGSAGAGYATGDLISADTGTFSGVVSGVDSPYNAGSPGAVASWVIDTGSWDFGTFSQLSVYPDGGGSFYFDSPNGTQGVLPDGWGQTALGGNLYRFSFNVAGSGHSFSSSATPISGGDGVDPVATSGGVITATTVNNTGGNNYLTAPILSIASANGTSAVLVPVMSNSSIDALRDLGGTITTN